jgi:hypothetical protein
MWDNGGMRKRENWLFGFAAIGAVAALTKILEFCGFSFNKTAIVNSPPVSGATPVPMTHNYSALIWGIGLFAFSIGLSLYGLYKVNRKRNAPQPVRFQPKGMSTFGIATIDYAPKITRDYARKTNGSGRQEIDIGFPVDFLRLYLPEFIEQVTRDTLPKLIRYESSQLVISIEGNHVILNDNGSEIPVAFLAYSSTPTPKIEVPRKDALETAPRPLITYDGAGEKIGERLADIIPIYNDGPTLATMISFGPLTWVDQRFFATAREIKPIPSKNQGTACLTFESRSPDHARIGPFVQFRESQGLKPTVTVTFQDPDGNLFCCDYTLHYKIGGTMRWNPDPVRQLELEDWKPGQQSHESTTHVD